jgi:WXG100 family type VII secretion target
MTISFDSGRIEALVLTLDAAATAIQAELDDLDGEVARLRGGWDGAARDAYDTAQREWKVAMDALRDALARAGQGVSAAADQLRSAGDSVAALWAE